MNIQDLEKQIRDRMDTFPTKTRRVAEYLLGNSSEVAFHSIGEVAERLSVSKAQLVRVARMFGFEGYADLKDVLKEALLAAAVAAEKGAERTKDIIATKGRASYLGERSLGHRDPGAVSSSFMLRAMADTM